MLAISILLLKHKTSDYFNEWDLMNYNEVWKFFNIPYYLKKKFMGKTEPFGSRYKDDYDDKRMYRMVRYIDFYYKNNIGKIFGYGGMCHYRLITKKEKRSHDDKYNYLCFRTKRNRNISIFVVYWILIQEMFINRLWKEIVILITFTISLFMKYGIVYLHKTYRDRFKKPSAPIEINQL